MHGMLISKVCRSGYIRRHDITNLKFISTTLPPAIYSVLHVSFNVCISKAQDSWWFIVDHGQCSNLQSLGLRVNILTIFRLWPSTKGEIVSPVQFNHLRYIHHLCMNNCPHHIYYCTLFIWLKATSSYWEDIVNGQSSSQITVHICSLYFRNLHLK